jgi:hypothetical protein
MRTNGAADADAEQKQKELLAETKKMAKRMKKEMAKETAAKAKALALTTVEAPANSVFELPFPDSLALPDDPSADVQAAVDEQSGDGLRSEPEPVDEGNN